MLWNILHPYQCLIPIDDRDISTIVQLPLAFVRSGYIHLGNGQSRGVGSGGYRWSSVALSTTTAYDLSIYLVNVNPSYNDNRWPGFPLHTFIIV